MAITNEFKDAVLTGKKIRVRIMLKDMMLVDPSLKQFEEMLGFAKSNMIDLFDEHNKEILKDDCSDWDEAYLNNQMVAVVSNFSQERIELLRNMVKYIYRDKIKKISASSQKQSTTTITKKQVGIGMAVAGATATVAGICSHQGLLVGSGVVVTAVGAGLIATDQDKNGGSTYGK